jgi:molybdopterin biosynthesis enzyme
MPREQEQFLEVVDRDTAERRWLAAIRADVPLPGENVPLADLLGRVLAEDVRAGGRFFSSASRADGFVVIPADLEGYPIGADVTVWLYD